MTDTDTKVHTNVEEIILGILLSNPEMAFEIGNRVTKEMFSAEAHMFLYGKMVSLIEENFVPNKQLLVNYLDSLGVLDSVGSDSYLTSLENLVTEEEIDNLGIYINLLQERFKARQVVEIVEIADKVRKGLPISSIDSVLEEILNKIEYIQNKGVGRNATSQISTFLKDAWKRIKEKVDNPGLTGVTTGFKGLDAITGGYNPGDYWIIGGRPGHGKTSTVLQSILKVAESGEAVLLFSLEMGEQQIVERFASLITGVDHLKIRLGDLDEDEIERVKDGFRLLMELPIFLSTIYELNATEIKTTIAKLVKTEDVKVVWIDYIQLTTERDGQATHSIGRVSRMCKLLSRNLGISIGVVSQLNRSVEQRDNKRPVKADLRQSGNLEEDADLIAFCYRDEIYKKDSKNSGKLEFIIDKHRNGPTGLIPMKFEKEIMKVSDA